MHPDQIHNPNKTVHNHADEQYVVAVTNHRNYALSVVSNFFETIFRNIEYVVFLTGRGMV